MVPLELKNLNDVEMLKSETRKWEPKKCKIMPTPGLLNTRPYMSHLRAKIKRPVFQKNSTK